MSTNTLQRASEEARRRRIEQGRPGSACRRTHVRFNTEFTEIPICAASRNYQRRKLQHLEGEGKEGLTPDQLALVREHVLAKSCICHDLGGGATVRYGIDPDASPAVCPGPGIADFSKIATLEEMVNHIYARATLPMTPGRPHMFIREIALYVKYLRDEIEWCSSGLLDRPANYFDEFKENLLSGIEYYEGLVQKFVELRSPGGDERQWRHFLDELGDLRKSVESISLVTVP